MFSNNELPCMDRESERESIARVFLVAGGSKAVRYDEETTVERVIHVVLNGIGISEVAHGHFALRLVAGPSPSTAGEFLWLHPYLLLSQLRQQFSNRIPPSSSDELKLELRIRFIPSSSYELHLIDANAFLYLHEQVFEAFLASVAWKVGQDAAIELAALKVARDYTERQTRHCMDNRMDLEGIDIDSAMQRFIPNTILANPSVKPQTIRKQFVHQLKRCAPLAPTESVLRSLALLVEIVKFDVEVFRGSLGIGWTTPVELLVQPDGVFFRMNERCEVTRLIEFRSVVEIRVRKMEHHSEKSVVRLWLAGNSQPVALTLATFEMAESFAHLVDGYQMLYQQSESVLKMKGVVERCSSAEMRAATVPCVSLPRSVRWNAVNGHATGQGSGEEGEDDMRIQREWITLKELLGAGQFCNVYKGLLNQPGCPPVTVAVKVCKTENESADTQQILQESRLMRRFRRHANIISLVGVCSDAPVWLVIELAPLGELRHYLQANRESLELSTLLLFGIQVGKALHYLHSSQFVHRDIAARNVLVSTPNCIKLSDFGLSRQLSIDSIYTASRGKLPIKWLAPESINYRQFSMASDVWMYGICLWEIFSFGLKPWPGVQNTDVITQIEAGVRPLCPEMCPIALHHYIEQEMWQLEPAKRPTVDKIVQVLESVKEQVEKNIELHEIRVIPPIAKVPVILTEISALPSLTLYRTLEEQKRQAELDDKWLAEQEDFSTYDPDTEDELQDQQANAIIPTEIKQTIDGLIIKERPTPVRLKALLVMDAVERLQNSYSQQMKHEEFCSTIREITAGLREMFAESTQALVTMTEERRREVERTETLISNDMRQMSQALQKLQGNGANGVSINLLRREIVRICTNISADCATFLEQLEQPQEPLTSTLASLLLTDC